MISYTLCLRRKPLLLSEIVYPYTLIFNRPCKKEAKTFRSVISPCNVCTLTLKALKVGAVGVF